jgi:hypothetical protein
LVIIVVGEVKSTIIIVVIHVVIDHYNRAPSVEEGVGDDSSKRRAADDVVTIDIAAVGAVIEVVGHAIVIYGSDVVRNVDVVVVVMVIRVYVRSVRGAVTMMRVVTFRMSARVSSLSVMATAGIPIAFIAGTRHRLRLCFSLFGVSSLDGRGIRGCRVGGRTGSSGRGGGRNGRLRGLFRRGRS